MNDDDTPRSVLEILQQHGTMNFDFVVTRDELRNRHDLKGIRKWLKVRRKEATAAGEEEIWRKLFALYGIPEEWPAVSRFEWLAGRLAAERFPRCQALWKPHGGGPSRERRRNIAELRKILFREFEAFRATHSRMSRQHAAGKFIKKNKDACTAAKLTTSNGFTRAYKKSAGTGV